MTGTRAARAGAGDYLRIRIGRTQFLMPVTGPVRVIGAPDGNIPSTPVLPEEDVPTLSIDETLSPIAAGTATAGCRLWLRSGTGSVVLACDAADQVGPEEVKLYPLPPCMLTPESVFSFAASVGDHIHGVCRAEDLLAALGPPATRNGSGSGDAP